MGSKITDSFYAFKFIRAIVRPWDEWPAFLTGVLDDKGKLIHSPKTKEQKDSYNTFDRLTANIKRAINKLPGGKTKLSSFAAAVYLLREWSERENPFERTCLMESFLYNLIRERVVDDVDGGDKTVPAGTYIYKGGELVVESNLKHVDTVMGVRVFVYENCVFAKNDLEKVI